MTIKMYSLDRRKIVRYVKALKCQRLGPQLRVCDNIAEIQTSQIPMTDTGTGYLSGVCGHNCWDHTKNCELKNVSTHTMTKKQISTVPNAQKKSSGLSSMRISYEPRASISVGEHPPVWFRSSPSANFLHTRTFSVKHQLPVRQSFSPLDAIWKFFWNKPKSVTQRKSCRPVMLLNTILDISYSSHPFPICCNNQNDLIRLPTMRIQSSLWTSPPSLQLQL